jgi:hypothetical protein
MATSRNNIDFYKEKANSIGWECLSKKYVGRTTKMMWKCPLGHVLEIRPDYFINTIVERGYCTFCKNDKIQRSVFEWFLQTLKEKGLDEEFFEEDIIEARTRLEIETNSAEKKLEKKLESKLAKYKQDLLEKEFQKLVEKRSQDFKNSNEEFVQLEQAIFYKHQQISELNSEINTLSKTVNELFKSKSDAFFDIEKSYIEGINVGMAVGLENTEKYLEMKKNADYGNVSQSDLIIFLRTIIFMEEFHINNKRNYYEEKYKTNL